MEIIISNLTKKYFKKNKKNIVLDNINVNFKYGKLYMIIGKSGAGKTSLLKCISQITKIDYGNIMIKNIVVNKLNDKELSNFRNNNIGFIFQNYNLLDFLTVEENVILPSLKNKKYCNKSKKRLENLLEYVGLKDKSEYFPTELSGGEQQRVAIARALINDPDIILADEPTGNIDNENKDNIIKLFKKLTQENKCIIVVTHDNEILKYADEIYTGKLDKYDK